MRIKLDENLPLRIKPILENIGHDVHTARDEGLEGVPDQEIWAAAQRDGRYFVTQDLDFSDIRSFTPGSHHGLMIIRLRAPYRRNLAERVSELFRRENDWARCVLIVTERKMRVVRPDSRKSR